MTGYSDNPEQCKLSESFVAKDNETGQSGVVCCSRAYMDCLFWRVSLSGGEREKEFVGRGKRGRFVERERMGL